MGGMFSVMKVREGLARDDYKDPGPYKHPSGTVAYEVKEPGADVPRQSGAASKPGDLDVTVVKPGANTHSNH
jgi:hypothetical protein